jgi:uncharacterized protein YecE (DUF72 family)
MERWRFVQWPRSDFGTPDEFPIVEVDSRYYAIPSEQTARLWIERTPDRFVFDVKAFRLFT